MKTPPILAKGLLALALLGMVVVFLQATSVMAKEHKAEFSAAELKKMSTFVSNFTELRLVNFTTAQLLNPDQPEEALHFAIWHNYLNNYRSRIVQCNTHECKWGFLAIDQKYVMDSLDKFFGKDARFTKALKANPPANFDGKLYHFDGADGEQLYLARVENAKRNADGTITMRGEIYNASDNPYEGPILSAFEAVARPHTHNGKATWAIISMSAPSAR